jgi:hypothetical protein
MTVRTLILALDGAQANQDLDQVRAAAAALLTATHLPAAHHESWMTEDRWRALHALSVVVDPRETRR